MINKLEYYGFRGLVKQWSISYLSERRQIVTVNLEKSAECIVSCGIPQGSVLGPLLFLLYINDFSKSSNIFYFYLFADDANLFYEAKNLSALETTVNCELTNVYIWLCANRLSLNIDKSNYVLFYPPQRNIQRFSFSLSINNHQLKREYCIKYLGLMIDSNLNWKKQVASVLKKVRRGIGILSKIRHYITIDILKSLYYALIYPFLIYGLIAWGNTYNTTLQPIYILQKAVRVITFSSFDHHSNPLFKVTMHLQGCLACKRCSASSLNCRYLNPYIKLKLIGLAIRLYQKF